MTSFGLPWDFIVNVIYFFVKRKEDLIIVFYYSLAKNCELRIKVTQSGFIINFVSGACSAILKNWFTEPGKIVEMHVITTVGFVLPSGIMVNEVVKEDIQKSDQRLKLRLRELCGTTAQLRLKVSDGLLIYFMPAMTDSRRTYGHSIKIHALLFVGVPVCEYSWNVRVWRQK